MSEYYKCFVNEKCEFFPCHKIADLQEFNCLFCFCPLYALKDECGGNFHYLANGIKDCSLCNYPHLRKNYDEVMLKCQKLMEMTQK